MLPSDATPLAAFQRDGFATLPYDPLTADWAAAARAVARPLVQDPAQRARWLRCAGTWFAGVDLLPNAADGAVEGVPLAGAALDLIHQMGLRPDRWHPAQVSVIYPGYPQPMEGESPAAARYRIARDAAHVDGLLPVGPDRRRKLREPHAFILGLPLNSATPTAAPLVVWRGSHRIIGPALCRVLGGHRVDDWPDLDLTEAYQTARRICFTDCERVLLPVQPGMATLLHRHILHGVSPWAAADGDGAMTDRMIAYFRPQFPDVADWVPAPPA
ncbi:hypothetical protein [Actibacterium sp. 188UL27-1]|uniref:hypothetical protein n=1 Tax=Actibacterium sp. 188UL27-1 TaxID=2786961 RepID=UPI00195778DF|nr:hypothetical protein [Actibacterium sp. 188UL27-1]MBM7070246.1 hypothetical protein [Actibacterium sp. 188UL27-1]